MLPKFRLCLALAAMVVATPAATVRAQGFIVDHHRHVPLARSYEVREVNVDARVRDQVAEVQVSQTFHNPGSFQLETEYLFPLPEDGAVQNFVLLVDGRELPGRIMPKDEARRIYEEIVRTKRDPALLEYMGRGLFKTSIFPIPPGADRKVTMRYTKVLPRDRDVVEFNYPFGTQKFTAKPIQRLELTARIDGRDPIKSLYSPSHDAEIRRSGDYQATVRLVQHDVIPTTDFRLVYTLSSGPLGATVLSYRPSESEDGYFLLLASPQVRRPDERPRPKTVVFVLDRSGSMSGKKIEQARNALKFVLDNLRDDDLFNIVAYDDRIETYKPELQRYSRDSRADAVRYVENIQPGGSTNINDALKTALGMLNKDDTRPEYVLFLTDGLPTAGETREGAIADNARKANDVHARLFAFGVGHDVNARLLDRLSGGNGGASEYVRPDEDIEAHVARFYAKLTSPVLTGIAVEFASTDLNRTYPRDVPDLFEGGQLVWVGRYRQSGRTEVVLRGKVGGERQEFRFPAELAGAGRGTSYDFVERLWAVRRVGFLIDQIDLHGQNRELTDELVSLSTKYGILTPYTSFLADERVRLYDHAANLREAGQNLRQLQITDGTSGVGQRASKGSYLFADKPQATEEERAKAALGSLSTAPAASAPAAAPAGGESLARRARGANPAGGAAGYGYAGRPGMMAGGMGGMGGAQKPDATRFGVVARDAEGKSVLVANVRQVGRKTFYLKDGRWVDSEVKPEDEAKATDVEQFSDSYFRLAREQDAEANQYLSFEEPVTVKMRGRVYRINRAKN
jgi:Ca-activated chloride channel homolog